MDAGLAITAEISSTPDVIASADRLILPGVGAFRACMDGLAAVDGLIEAMNDAVHRDGRPTLGICVGMQLLADTGLEFGERSGLGWIPGRVRAIDPAPGRRIPHMGWNTVTQVRPHGALNGLPLPEDFYFAHSFHFEAENADHVIGVTDYVGPLTALIGRDTIIGAQCHPEKSQLAGRRLITGFLAWQP